MRTITGRFFAALAVASAVRMLVPTEAMAQQSQAPGPPVTTAPATEATAGPAAGGELQKVTVTGYLIPRIGDGPQPVTTLDQDFITKQADQTVSDVIARLPEAVGSLNPVTTAGNSFSPAEQAVGLKGLPYNATLTLVDGIRFPAAPFASNSVTGGPVSFVDLNSFPLASVDRIEILKDGGSATYGSDAVAGVINLILKTDYKGTDLNYYYGISQRGDFAVNHGQFVSGISHNFSETSKLSVVASFDIYTQTPIESLDRAYASFLQHSRYSSKYPDQANFWSPQGVFNDAAGNTYSVKPGTAGPNITPNNFNINNGFTENFDTKSSRWSQRKPLRRKRLSQL